MSKTLLKPYTPDTPYVLTDGESLVLFDKENYPFIAPSGKVVDELIFEFNDDSPPMFHLTGFDEIDNKFFVDHFTTPAYGIIKSIED